MAISLALEYRIFTPYIHTVYSPYICVIMDNPPYTIEGSVTGLMLLHKREVPYLRTYTHTHTYTQ
jgi:hypothetical protein